MFGPLFGWRSDAEADAGAGWEAAFGSSCNCSLSFNSSEARAKKAGTGRINGLLHLVPSHIRLLLHLTTSSLPSPTSPSTSITRMRRFFINSSRRIRVTAKLALMPWPAWLTSPFFFLSFFLLSFPSWVLFNLKVTHSLGLVFFFFQSTTRSSLSFSFSPSPSFLRSRCKWQQPDQQAASGEERTGCPAHTRPVFPCLPLTWLPLCLSTSLPLYLPALPSLLFLWELNYTQEEEKEKRESHGFHFEWLTLVSLLSLSLSLLALLHS